MKKLLTISLVAALAAAQFSPVQALKSDRLGGVPAAGPSLKTKVIVGTFQVLSVAAVLTMGYMAYLSCATDENATPGSDSPISTALTVVKPTPCNTGFQTPAGDVIYSTINATGACIPPEIGTPCSTGSSDYSGTIAQTNDGYACFSTATLAETMAHEASKTLANLWSWGQ